MNVAIVVRAIATLSWIILLGAVVLGVIRVSRGRPVKGILSIVIAALLLAIILTTVSSGLVFIQPDERGVVISAVAPKGYREQALEPGLHWIIPFFENVITYTISKQTYTMSIAPAEGQRQGDDSIFARTADGQEVLVDASVIFSIDPTQVVQVHIDWQDRYSNDLVRPLARGVIRDVVSQFGVEEVYSTQRTELNQQINEGLRARLNENGLLLVDFILRNITFSDEYAASVEQKQIAEQQAKQAAFVVEQRKQEAEQARQVAQGQADATIIRAEGQAEARVIEAEAEQQALRLIADALQDNQDLLTYQYILKLSPGIQVMLVPSENPLLLPLPTLESQGDTSSLPSLRVPTPTPTAIPQP